MEIWKDIKGYENRYQVSNLGRIKSLPKNGRKEELILKPQPLKTGYLSIDLCKDSKTKKLSIHRIVAKTFIENTFNKEEVNHINGLKTDNRVENLEWNTKSENQKHSIRIGLRSAKGIKNSQVKLKEEEVLIIYNSLEKYNILSEKYNVSISTISDIKRGYSWVHITGHNEIRKPKHLLK